MARPIVVLGTRSPKPTVVMVITVNQRASIKVKPSSNINEKLPPRITMINAMDAIIIALSDEDKKNTSMFSVVTFVQREMEASTVKIKFL